MIGPMTKACLFMLFLFTWLPARAEVSISEQQALMGCYRAVRPYTGGGVRVPVIPSDADLAIVTGGFERKKGIYTFTEAGVSFFTTPADVSPGNRAYEFQLNVPPKGLATVFFHPHGMPGGQPVAILYGSNAPTVATPMIRVFKDLTHPGLQAVWIPELEAMIRNVRQSYQARQDQVTRSGADVDVGLGAFKDSLEKCRKSVSSFEALNPLLLAVQEQIGEFRSVPPGAHHAGDEKATPSPGNPEYTAPQY